jgi:D-alanine--(R)-lactate ligase
MARVRLGILFGGVSEEHPISVKSAREVARSLDADLYDPYWIGITTGGSWRLCEGPDGDWERAGSRPAVLSPDRSVHGLLVRDPECSDGARSDAVRLDVVLPVLHGRLGEDGAIQGLLELAGIPYVGCGIAASAVCMDKALTYTVAAAAGIATPRHRVLHGTERIDADRLPYPVFVKPARSGSSFGVTRVTRPEELPAALEAARRYDAKILIEEAVEGSEIGCAILGERFGPVTGELDRVALDHGFFRIHQEDSPETGSENSTFIVPADIPEDARLRVQRTATAVYRALGCRGLARVDTFLTPDGRVVLNEVNTLPGLTSYSRYPRMMAAAGLPLSDVVDRLVALALHRAGR